jgi:hypothetical protein
MLVSQHDNSNLSRDKLDINEGGNMKKHNHNDLEIWLSTITVLFSVFIIGLVALAIYNNNHINKIEVELEDIPRRVCYDNWTMVTANASQLDYIYFNNKLKFLWSYEGIIYSVYNATCNGCTCSFFIAKEVCEIR